jgi:hypothetical protein
MTGTTTARTAVLITALAVSLTATSALAETATFKTVTSKANAAKASVKTLAKANRPASTLEAARDVSSGASIDQRPDVPGHPPAQPRSRAPASTRAAASSAARQ